MDKARLCHVKDALPMNNNIDYRADKGSINAISLSLVK